MSAGSRFDGSIERESMVSVRDTASSVPIGTPSTVRPATDQVPLSSGRPPEHWPVTRASSARMPTRSPVGAASAWIAGLMSMVPKPGTLTAGTLGGAGSPGRPGSSGIRSSPRLASAETRWPAGLLAAPSARVRANARLPLAPPGRPGRRGAAGASAWRTRWRPGWR